MTASSVLGSASQMTRRLTLVTLVALAVSACSGGGGGDYGPSSDVQKLRAAWQANPIGGAITQVVVVQNYGIIDLTNTGTNPPFVELFERGDYQGADVWELDYGTLTSSSIYGPIAACALTFRGVPQDVANEIVAHDTRLAAAARQNPNAGCSG
jgi:hypothetical protein